MPKKSTFHMMTTKNTSAQVLKSFVQILTCPDDAQISQKLCTSGTEDPRLPSAVTTKTINLVNKILRRI